MMEPPSIGEDDLQAYIDGRLSGERRLDVEAYLKTHPDDESRVAQDRQLRDALRAGLAGKFNEPIPDRLRIAAIRARQQQMRRPATLRKLAYAAGLLVFGGLAGWFSNDLIRSKFSEPSNMRQDAEAAYRTFVVDRTHPVELWAKDEAHLMQWLSKRLGRPVLAPDITSFGFHFIGGRLLPGEEAPAAMLMYEDDKGTRLTAYIRTVTNSEKAFKFVQDGPVATCIWFDRGLGIAVTASADRERLLPIGKAIYRSLDDHRS